jgi:hypothetical protein
MKKPETRSVEDLLLAIVNTMKSFPDVIRAAFRGMVQTCTYFVQGPARRSPQRLSDLSRGGRCRRRGRPHGFEDSAWQERYPVLSQSSAGFERCRALLRLFGADTPNPPHQECHRDAKLRPRRTN